MWVFKFLDTRRPLRKSAINTHSFAGGHWASALLWARRAHRGSPGPCGGPQGLLSASWASVGLGGRIRVLARSRHSPCCLESADLQHHSTPALLSDFFQRCFVKRWKIIVSQVSLKSKFSCYCGYPGPISAFIYFYLFNPNQLLPRGLLFLEGENGTAVGLTDNKSQL